MDTNEELARMLERLRDQGKPQREPPGPEKARSTEQGWQLPVQPGDFAPEDEWQRIRERVARDAELADQQKKPRSALPEWVVFLVSTLALFIILSGLFLAFSR